MEGHQTGPGLDRAMQRGDVGIAEQDLGIALDRRVVQQRQQARGTGPAAGADDGLHRAVGEHRVEVAGAVGVATGQVAAAVAVVRTGLHHEAQRLHRLARQLQAEAVLERRGRAHQADGVALRQRNRQQASWWRRCRRGGGRQRPEGGGPCGAAQEMPSVHGVAVRWGRAQPSNGVRVASSSTLRHHLARHTTRTPPVPRKERTWAPPAN